MTIRGKWVWILIAANVAVAILAIFILWATLSVAGIAASVSGTPLFSALLVGMVLSVVGLVFAKRERSSLSRRACYIASASALAVHSLIITGLVGLFFGAQEVRYIIPEGYMGDVFVIHSAEGSESEARTNKAITYHIPSSGIFSTKTPIFRGSERALYYYQGTDGKLQRITNEWLPTIHPTRENLADDKEIGIFFPRTGNLTLGPYSPSECRVEYEQFYVGTKAYLLSGYKEKDLSPYLKQNPAACGKRLTPRDYDTR